MDNYINKENIISILDSYNFDKNSFYVIAGAALVLNGVCDRTLDIDICTSNEYYHKLINDYECVFERVNEYGESIYLIDNIINFGTSFMPSKYVLINGYRVASINDCYLLKKYLNRDKDLEVIKLLEVKLNSE